MMVLLASLTSLSPAAASPPDPTNLDELRSSLAYRADHADLMRLYQAFFKRQPDLGGAIYWMGIYDDGASLDELAWSFANSAEFLNTYGAALTNSEFLEIVYGNVLGRTPDPVGMAYWLDQMANGLSQHGVVRWVAANQEFINRHPFADLRADVSTTMLTLTDMPTGWSEDNRSFSHSIDPASCEALFWYPERASRRSFDENIATGLSAYLATAGYAWPTKQGAMDYMANVRNRVNTDCGSYVDSEGWTITQSLMSYPNYGDDTLAIRQVHTHPESSVTWIVDTVNVRYGSAITGVWHLDWSAIVFPTEDWVALLSERLIDLAGP